MIAHALLSLAFACFIPLVGAEDEIAEGYRAAHAARDEARLVELWRAHPGRILTTIDEDLEGSLAVWEAAPDAPDRERIAALSARAVWGATVASRVTGRPIFRDYAASFVGWTAAEKKRFRAGQAAYGRARAALKAGDGEVALKAASECRELALPLGDWWGTAMGLSGEGRALAALGRHEEALAAFARARLLYAQLGLAGSELGQVRGMVAALVALERWPRARAAADDGVVLARALGDADGMRALLRQRAAAERALGDEEAAEATEREAGR